MFLSIANKIKWKLLGVAAAIVAALVVVGINWWDAPIFLFLRRFNCGLFELFGYVFATKVWLVASAIVLVVFYIKKIVNSGIKYKSTTNRFSVTVFLRDFIVKTKNSYAFFTFCSIFSATVVTGLLKVMIGRARPVFFEALGITGFYPFSFDWAFNSMPSGHAAASFAALVTLGMLVPRVKPATWTLAIIIGVSRVCVGAHWPSDVLLGAFIGMVAADFVIATLRRIK